MKIFSIIFLFISICFAQIEPKKDLLYLNTILNLNSGKLDISDSKYLPVKAKPFTAQKNKINYYALSGVIVAGGTTIGIIRNYYANTWWKNQSTEFKFVNDWDYALWIDKFGHFFATYALSNLVSSGLDAANIKTENVFLYSSISALLFQLYVEVEDGFGPNWGFSPGDAVADFLGAGFRLAQFYYPSLKNVLPKFSYYPSEEFRNGEKKDHNMSDDYEGQKLWLSLRINNMLNKSIEKYWPDFLMLSIGYAVRKLDGKGGGEKHFLIALDLDFEKIPLHGKFWNFIKNTLNLVHFPMPGIRITPKGTFFEIIF